MPGRGPRPRPGVWKEGRAVDPESGEPAAPDRGPPVIDVGHGSDPRSPRSVIALIVVMMVLAAVLTIAGFHLVRPAGWRP